MNIRRILGSVCIAAGLVSPPALAQEVAIPTQTLDPALRAGLPKSILDAGEIVAVNSGSFPPYEIVTDSHTMTGASADLLTAFGELWGIKVRFETVNGFAGILSGIKSGRYQMASGASGDFPEREAVNDFVDYVREYVVFAVQVGNPKGIKSLADACGSKVAVMSAGSAERVIKQQAEICAKDGKPALEVQSYPDQPTAILAVRSKRADAFFSSQAPLTYFVRQSNGQLELAGTGQSNGFDMLYQGTIVPKDSALTQVVYQSYKKLFDNGTYATIMKKWGLEGNMIKEPGIDLAGRKPQ